MFNKKRTEAILREKREEVFKVLFLFFLIWMFFMIIILNIFDYDILIGYILAIFHLGLVIKIIMPAKIEWLVWRREINSFQDYPKLWNSFSFFHSDDYKLPILFLANAKDLFAYNISVNFFKKTETVVSQGLVDAATEEELKATIGHEIGHLKNKDTLLKCLFDFFLKGILFFSGLSIFTSLMPWLISVFAISRAISLLILILISIYLGKLVFDFFFFPALMFFKAYLFQQMEYAADMFAAKETGNPKALARALVKIKRSSPIIIYIGPNARMQRKIKEAYSTHPIIEKRVALLLSLDDK